jgi:hypothetical protein
MAAKKRKAAAKSKEPKQTSLSPDGFREPLAIDDVPWRKAGAGSRAFQALRAQGYQYHAGSFD